jgi:hypothetical protein
MGYQLWDRISALMRRANIFRQERLFADQTHVDRVISGGELLDFSKQHAILEQTNLQINRLERYKDFDQMDEVGEVSMGMDMYADESTETDSERKHAVMVRAKSKIVKDELEDFLHNTLNIDSFARPAIRYLSKYGDGPFEIIPTKDRDAVASLKHMNVYNFTRVETKFGDLVGFFYQDELAQEPIFLHPWSVIHMRLTSFENIYHPYGRSILDPARKGFKQLRLMEDAALIYRITRAPERRVFKIPVGNIPTKEVQQYLEQISKQFKKRRIFNPATGGVDERWSPLIQEDDSWLPQRPEGIGPDVTTLPGGQNLDQIADIVYFKKKVLSAMKIPFAKVGLSEGTGEESMKRASHMSPEFATAVQWVQREFLTGLKKACIVHLALKGFKIEHLKGFDLFMTASSAIDELYRIETWKSRADVIRDLKDTGLFPDRWIVRSFTDLTEEEIDELEMEKAAAAAAGGEEEEEESPPKRGGGGGKGIGSLKGFTTVEPEAPAPEAPAPAPGGGEAAGGPEAAGGGAAPAAGGGAAGPGAGGAGGAAAGVPEGYNQEMEKSLILEMARLEHTKPSEKGFTNGFVKMVNSKEFDGLRGKKEEIKTSIVGDLLTESVNRGKMRIREQREWSRAQKSKQKALKMVQLSESEDPTEADLPPA